MSALDLRMGDFREVMQDVTAQACIADPPYGSRTHNGNADLPKRCSRSDLSRYVPWTAQDVAAFVAFWSPRTSGWICAMTSDDLIPAWRDSFGAAGRLDFAPVPILQHRVRMFGDGPGSGAVYLMVARPREKRFLSWGSLPCWYMSQPDKTGIVNGAKPLALMRQIVRDYSRHGDLVCDPCAGGGTTLLAAAMEGRRSVGAELSVDTYQKAMVRLQRGYTLPLFTDGPDGVRYKGSADCGDRQIVLGEGGSDW